MTGCTINIGGESTVAVPESVVPESSIESTDENTDVAAAGDGIEVEPVIPPLGEFDLIAILTMSNTIPASRSLIDFYGKGWLTRQRNEETVGEVEAICRIRR